MTERIEPTPSTASMTWVGIYGPGDDGLDGTVVERLAHERFGYWWKRDMDESWVETFLAWDCETFEGREHFYRTGSLEAYMAQEHAFIAAHPGIETP